MSDSNLSLTSWPYAGVSMAALRSPRQPLRLLPKKLGHADNIDFLTGAASGLGIPNIASIVEEALNLYANSFDLLKLMNVPMTGDLHKAPDLAIVVKPNRSIDLMVCGPADMKPTSSAPYKSIDGTGSPGRFGWPLFFVSIFTEAGSFAAFHCPLLFLLSTASSIVGRYVVYSHSLYEDYNNKCYVGITKQGWAARWSQHCYSAKSGSPYLFHEAIRRADGKYAQHEILACGLDFNEAMFVEETAVAGTSLYPKGLNMIPGGHAGLRYLGKRGFHPQVKNLSTSWDRKHLVLQSFAAHCTRAGKPNPLVAARWLDDKYAASVICSNPNNFNLDQVNEIRYMESLGHSIADIAQHMNCAERRIVALIAGETYSKVQ